LNSVVWKDQIVDWQVIVCGFVGVTNEVAVAIGEGELGWLIAAQCVDSGDDVIGSGNGVPAYTDDFLTGAQSHELESSLQVSTRAKRDSTFSAGDLTVACGIFFVHLAVLANLEAQMPLLVKRLPRENGFATKGSRNSSLHREEIEEFNSVSYMWIVKSFGIRSNGRLCRVAWQRSFTTLMRRSIPGTCSLVHARFKVGPAGMQLIKDLTGANSASASTMSDTEATMEIVLIDLVESIENCWNRPVW
jgi:hypothetical protein